VLVAGALAATVAVALTVALAAGLRPGSDGTTPQIPTISTFAGTGRTGFAGDGGPATLAELSDPGAVGVDHAGNVYVGEWGEGSRLRRIGRDGIIRTVPVSFSGGDFAVAASGDVYVVDWPAAIWRIDRRGVTRHIAGSGDVGVLSEGVRTVSPDLCRIGGVAVDPAGAVYVSCPTGHRVIRIERDGVYTTVAGSGEAGYDGDGRSATEVALHGPQGIAFDAAGNLYIADQFNHRVRKVDTRGIITTFAGTGEQGVSGDGFRARFVDLWSPVDVDVDARGNVYILEGSVSRLRKVGRNGIITTVAGTGRIGFSGDGGPAADAELALPVSFALDREGNIFIADRANQRVRKVTVAD
jgi:hypothetical protein